MQIRLIVLSTKMEVIIQPKGEIKINIPVKDIVDDINQQPLMQRFAVVAHLLNHIFLNDKQDLEQAQKAIIVDFLRNTLEIFENSI